MVSWGRDLSPKSQHPVSFQGKYVIVTENWQKEDDTLALVCVLVHRMLGTSLSASPALVEPCLVLLFLFEGPRLRLFLFPQKL